MSTEQGSSRPEDKTEGLSKYIKRMRTVLKRNSTAKPASDSNMQETTGAESSSAETYVYVPFCFINAVYMGRRFRMIRDIAKDKTYSPKSAANPATTEATTATSPQKKQKSTTRNVQAADATVVSHWSTVQQEKARALFAKYGLSLEPGEWKSPSDMTVQRVSKPIRMRVRRTCHRCQTTFGPDRICVNCQHVRCKKCPRHPLPKSKPETTMPTATATATTTAGIAGISGIARARGPVDRRTKDAVHPNTPLVLPYRKSRQPEITLPSHSGGQDLVRRAVRQRVRRWCHRCEALFPTPEATECISCGHARCKKCPREPYVKTTLVPATLQNDLLT